MGVECERKFLLSDTSILDGLQGRSIEQGYLAMNERVVVRVRLTDEEAFFTIKQATPGVTRLEYDCPVSRAEAREIFDGLAQRPIIQKVRYEIEHHNHTWEVDRFFGENEGLIVAEIELEHEDEPFETPGWIGEEVTQDKRYYNAHLVIKPYKEW